MKDYWSSKQTTTFISAIDVLLKARVADIDTFVCAHMLLLIRLLVRDGRRGGRLLAALAWIGTAGMSSPGWMHLCWATRHICQQFHASLDYDNHNNKTHDVPHCFEYFYRAKWCPPAPTDQNTIYRERFNMLFSQSERHSYAEGSQRPWNVICREYYHGRRLGSIPVYFTNLEILKGLGAYCAHFCDRKQREQRSEVSVRVCCMKVTVNLPTCQSSPKSLTKLFPTHTWLLNSEPQCRRRRCPVQSISLHQQHCMCAGGRTIPEVRCVEGWKEEGGSESKVEFSARKRRRFFIPFQGSYHSLQERETRALVLVASWRDRFDGDGNGLIRNRQTQANDDDTNSKEMRCEHLTNHESSIDRNAKHFLPFTRSHSSSEVFSSWLHLNGSFIKFQPHSSYSLHRKCDTHL